MDAEKMQAGQDSEPADQVQTPEPSESTEHVESAEQGTLTEPIVLPRYERFDFGDSGQVTQEQLRLLRSLDELLARNLTNALSAWLRTNVNVTAQPQEQQQFSDFLERTENCYLLSVHLPDLHAAGLLRWPLSLATHLIELLLGGSGSKQADARELTEIEDEVFAAVLAITLREWNGVWQQIALRFEAGERARNGSERQLLPVAERIFSFTFAVQVGEISEEISLCMAAPVLASVLRRVSTLRRPMRTGSDTEMQQLLASLRAARVRTSLCFGPVQVMSSRVSALRPGSTLTLPLASNCTAELRISDVPVAVATPVRVGERRGARIGIVRDLAVHPALLPANTSPNVAERGNA